MFVHELLTVALPGIGLGGSYKLPCSFFVFFFNEAVKFWNQTVD